MKDKINELKSMIDSSNSIVVFTGAGVSTDSGIRDFRGKNGLYKDTYQDEDPEYLLSNLCFFRETKMFYNYYRDTFNCLDILPNITHMYLKKLEDIGKLKAIITQNIDGLHTKAGSKCVYEIHGSIYDNYCLKCGKHYNAEKVFNSKGIPLCSCGGLIKPSVVLYGESLPMDVFQNAIKKVEKADMLIVLGSSLTVYPASSIIDYFHGKHFVILNEDSTSFDDRADLIIRDNLSSIFKSL